MEAAFMQGLLELAALLARGGAIAELAALSVDGMAHGESLTPVEALALHVKALEVMSSGIEVSTRLAAIRPPPRLAPAVSEALSQAEQLKARVVPLLRSAEACRTVIAERGGAHGRSGCIDASASRSQEGGGGGGSGGVGVGGSDIGDVGGALPTSPPTGASVEGGRAGVAQGASDSEAEPSSVCVEEVLYRQALSMGREAAVDELLGQYESAAVLYTRAKLTLEQLALEPVVGEADRAVLLKYGAGFAWRLHEMRGKTMVQSLATSPEHSQPAPLAELSQPAPLAELSQPGAEVPAEPHAVNLPSA